MMLNEPRNLSDYLAHLQSRGQVVFTDQQAQQALGNSKRSLLDAAEKQQRRGRLLSPRRGFYVTSPRSSCLGARSRRAGTSTT